MSISSTQPITRQPTPEQVQAVQRAIDELMKNPDALYLARMQNILNISKIDNTVKETLRSHIDQVNALAKSLGHEVI